MALNYSPLFVTGSALSEPILGNLFFENKTLANGLVDVITDVKTNVIFTEYDLVNTLQPYVCGEPTSSGSTTLTDVTITPAKYMVYESFCPDTIRKSRFGSKQAGAWNILDNAFAEQVLSNKAPDISGQIEKIFWNGILTATQTTVSNTATGSTLSTAEKTLAAAQTVAQFDGLIARVIASGKARSIVAGTTVTSSNIVAEFAKIYAAIPALLEGQTEAPEFYCPLGFKQMIQIANVSATYRNIFEVSGDNFSYLGVKINFVQINGSTVLVHQPSKLHFISDLVSDLNYIQIDKVQNNSDELFLKMVFTLESYVSRAELTTLYV